MSLWLYYEREHLAQREAAPQIAQGTTKSHLTPPPLPTKFFSTRPSNNDDDAETTEVAPTRPTSTGVLLGAPVVATQQPEPEPEPSPTQQASPDSEGDNSQNTSPSPTQDSPVAAPTSVNNSPTTFATSTMTTSDMAADTSSSSRPTSKTTTAVAGSATNESAASTNSSEGMSTGGKVGLAVGIIAIIGVFAVFLMLFMAKKRKQREALEKENDEKRAAEQAAAASAAAAAAAAKQRTSAPNAPRLSLRPVSRLVPDLMGGNRAKNRNSQGNMLTTFSETRGDRSMSPAANAQPAYPKENPFNDPVNPFNDPEKGMAGGAAATYHQPHGQAHELEDTRSMTQTSRPGTSQGQFPGAPAPAVATGPGPDQPQGNVYRVLMEFKPTMEDELELIVGSHVRLLHEYDDGWALCIKLDRSHQGVVPRTCLAAKPSKPRPAPGQGPHGQRGPPGPHGRPITPSGPGGPRMNSPGFRPDSPASRPQTSGSGAPRQEPSPAHGTFNQAPRPLSPGPRQPKRSESPGPYGAGGPPPMHGASQRPRSNSASNTNGPGPRNSPPGRSNLGPGAPNGPGYAF